MFKPNREARIEEMVGGVNGWLEATAANAARLPEDRFGKVSSVLLFVSKTSLHIVQTFASRR